MSEPRTAVAVAPLVLTLPDPAARSAAGLPPVHVGLGYGYATGPDCQPDLEYRLKLHAAAHGLWLTHLLIDTPRSGRRAFDALVALLSRRHIRHVVVPSIGELGDSGSGWLIRRILELEFQTRVHAFDDPIE
jgi:hypothetical protein